MEAEKKKLLCTRSQEKWNELDVDRSGLLEGDEARPTLWEHVLHGTNY